MGNIAQFPISVGGGLDLISTTQEMNQKPGFARQLINFESALTGGYRRISGYEKLGGISAASVGGETTQVLGLYPYADGVVACIEEDIYFSTDGTSWLQINKDLSAGGNGTALAAASAVTRTNQGRCTFVHYEGNTPHGELLVLDGTNDIFYIKFVGDGVGRMYYTNEIDYVATAVPQAQWGTVFKDHVILVGDPTEPDTIFWSNAFEPTNFTGGTSGFIQVPDIITGVVSWRDKLIVFGKNSISEIVDINGQVSLQSISRNIGCISGWTIQEIGGDIVWLAPDGLRNIAGTAKIDDIELSSISRNISPIINNLINQFDNYTITSMVIRSKNQYRLYYIDEDAIATTGTKQYGIIGTYKMSQEGLRWEWSETLGIHPYSTTSIINESLADTFNKSEVILHGGLDGYVYLHDSGNSFNGDNIDATYEVPELDYGDIGTKKTLHWIDTFFVVEGANTSINMYVSYDFGSSSTMQPNTYKISDLLALAVYDDALFDSAEFSSTARAVSRVRVEGSGYSHSIKITSFSSESAFSISNMYIRFYTGKPL